MAIPSFVPIIGSGPNAFSDIGQQQLAWQGFNRQVDESNLRRQQMADEAANNWFTQLAHLQASESARRDQADLSAAEIARRAEADQRNSAVYQAQTAEGKRQFDLTQNLNEQKFKLSSELQKDTQKKQEEFIRDLATTSAPHVDAAGKAWESAGKQTASALTDFNAGAARWEKELPGSRWNARTNQLERVDPLTGRSMPWKTKEEQDKANQAAADMAERKSAYLTAVAAEREADSTWSKLMQKFGNDLVPIKDENGNWGLRAPSLKESFFAKELKKAKEAVGAPGNEFNDEQGVDAPFIPKPVVSPPSFPAAIGIGPGFGGQQSWTGTPTTASAPVSPVSAPVAATVPAPIPTAPANTQSSNVGFIPESSPFWNNISQLPAAGLRAANYVLAGPHSREEPGPSLTWPGFLGAAAGRDTWTATVPPGRVRVMRPDGKTGTIPEDQIRDAAALGYKVIPLNG